MLMNELPMTTSFLPSWQAIETCCAINIRTAKPAYELTCVDQLGIPYRSQRIHVLKISAINGQPTRQTAGGENEFVICNMVFPVLERDRLCSGVNGCDRLALKC